MNFEMDRVSTGEVGFAGQDGGRVIVFTARIVERVELSYFSFVVTKYIVKYFDSVPSNVA